MRIRSARQSDLDRIASIQAASPEAAQWKVADYLRETCSVAEFDGVTTGFLVVRETAPGESEVLNMAVDPAFRGRGIGAALLRQILHGDVFLEVRESNNAARRLYLSAGFRDCGRRRGYYSEPPEDAIVMHFFS
ncbi:MAG: ribosomal protein S18-alanine N-acetyltransferase [Bryobacteraceae bacterium]